MKGKERGKVKSKKSKTKAKSRKRDEIGSDDSLNDFIDDTEIAGKKKPRTTSRR